MSKGARVKQIHHDDELTRLRLQKEELIQQVALERTNSHRANIVMACLVKRLGAVLADGKGWKVLVTDEEIEGMDGELQVHYDMPTAAIVLTLLKKEEPDAVGEDQGELDSDPAEAAVQEAVPEQAPVAES